MPCFAQISWVLEMCNIGGLDLHVTCNQSQQRQVATATATGPIPNPQDHNCSPVATNKSSVWLSVFLQS